jgi:4-diphosphocytidyl-2-C-methyl-D-erythritol kinase
VANSFIQRKSPCKINLLLNILHKRLDGFHELETVMHPIPLYDSLSFERVSNGIQLTCSDASLPVDSKNLVMRAATALLEKAKIRDGVKIYLQKNIPIAAGLGGGSGNAATTMVALNELFGRPLDDKCLNELARSMGSDVPFFLQSRPALATGRGEKIRPLYFFPVLDGAWVFLVHPGFGISTAWAYQELAKFPQALNGTAGRGEKLVTLLSEGNLSAATNGFYNSLEAPALKKYPLLVLFQEFFREQGAIATLMSGSGSTTFALLKNEDAGSELSGKFFEKFGDKFWTKLLPLVEASN